MSTTTYYILRVVKELDDFWISCNYNSVAKISVDSIGANLENYKLLFSHLNAGGYVYIRVRDFAFYEIDTDHFKVYRASLDDWSREKDLLL